MMQEIVNLNKALAEPNRLRVLMALRGGELCVCQITELLGLAPSTVSKHMAVLRQAGLVESWKQGRWVHYGLAGPHAPAPARRALAWLGESLAPAEQVAQDQERLRAILLLDKHQLCKQQGRCLG